MKKAAFPCRLCGASAAVNLGPIPDCGEFAGRAVEPALEGGFLMECRGCGSLFRAPAAEPSFYLALYSRAPACLWQDYWPLRNDAPLVRGVVARMGGGRVLDVGCGAGLFLRELPAAFARFGVEPAGEAAEAARAAGIKIVGETLAGVEAGLEFDCVTALDVVEHLVDVRSFLDEALRRTKEGGLLVLTTADPECLFWKRILRGRFWYVSLAEHLTFPSRRFFAAYCRDAGLLPPGWVPFSYLRRPLAAKGLLAVAQALFFLSPSLYRLAERAGRRLAGMEPRRHRAFGLAAAGLFRDHQLIVIRKERAR